MKIYAKVAILYKINPFALSYTELLALDYCRSYAQAIEELRVRSCDSELSPERMYEIALEITDDKEEALIQKAERWLAITRSTSS